MSPSRKNGSSSCKSEKKRTNILKHLKLLKEHSQISSGSTIEVKTFNRNKNPQDDIWEDKVVMWTN